MATPPPIGMPGRPSVSAGRIRADGSRLYRLTGPVIIWWAWVVIAVAVVVDLLAQARDVLTAPFLTGLAALTGLAFAGTIWPRVVVGAAEITVWNPFRVHSLPTECTGARTASALAVPGLLPGMGVPGWGILNTGMIPPGVTRISWMRVSIAVFCSAAVPLAMTSVR